MKPLAPWKPGVWRHRLEMRYTPKHGEYGEIELSVLKGQCLDRRIPDMATLQAELDAWQNDRNNCARKISWQFTTHDSRVHPKRLYPSI